MPTTPKAVALLLLAVALAATAAEAQSSGDAILARLQDGARQDAYDLRAEFSGTLTLVLAGTRHVIRAAGAITDVQQPGHPRRVTATVAKIEMPLLLRPFAGTLGGAIRQLIETQGDDPTAMRSHDLAVIEQRADGRIVLAGVRRDIVDEAITRYRPGTNKDDAVLRAAVARWLYTSPGMRAWMRRSGPPYAFGLVLDDQGLAYETTVSYDWGEVGNRIGYAEIQGHQVWSDLALDVAGSVGGLGDVTGRLVLRFTNHVLKNP